MKEVFKDIAGYEGKYQVSNLGHVKSLKYGKERILRPGKNGDGYLHVILCKNGKPKKYKVHRLVTQAFIPNPDNLPCVNHKDQNKKNNKASNLEWCDNQYNVRYSIAKKIGCFKDGKLIKVYDAVIDVDKDGFYHENVSKCCKGKLKSTSGYQWKYIN